MTGGFISLRYFNADTTCITIDLASLSGIVLCWKYLIKYLITIIHNKGYIWKIR